MRREDDEAGRGEAGGDKGPADGGTPATGPFAEPWLLGACLCLLAAAACLVLGYFDAAFVAATLGAVAWFVNVRSKLPRPPEEDDDEDEQTPEEDDPHGRQD